MVRSGLKYLLEAQILNLKCQVFGGKTGPFPMVQVVQVVRPVTMIRFRVEQDPEPTQEFGPVAITIHIQVAPKSKITSHFSQLKMNGPF